MKTANKAVIIISSSLVGLLLILWAGINIFVRLTWPALNGKIRSAGIENTVEIIRDKWGIPHIFADGEKDLLFAQGFVHAQDRLWQMEMNRSLAKGTVSRLTGSSGVEIDKYFRTLGLHRIAKGYLRNADEITRNTLEAYAAGVNAFIGRGKLPLEYRLLGVTPEPWLPEDTLAIGNLLGHNMAINYGSEIMRAGIIGLLGEQAAADLMLPAVKNVPYITLEQLTALSGSAEIRNTGEAKGVLFNPSARWGSNNWVVSGKRTKTGQPLLASDTHMDFTMPSVWYENGLHCNGIDAVGLTTPGVPFNIIGHNSNIAWAVTNLDPDVQDLYLETLDDPAQPARYLFENEWKELKKITETIKIKGAADLEFTVLETHHGPLVNGIFNFDKDKPIALCWSLAYCAGTVIKSIALTNKAAGWEEFCEALSFWDGLHENFVYADKAGNIGYQATGKIPVRSTAHSGTVPVPGWTGANEWQGFIPYKEMPRMFNPAKGYIATANNKVTDNTYPYNIASDWFYPGYRARRIEELLSSDTEVNMDDMQKMQKDILSIPARTLVPVITGITPPGSREQQALAILKNWDYQLDENLPAPMIFEVFIKFMIINTFSDELGELTTEYLRDYAWVQAAALIEKADDADNKWFDDVNTPGRENRDAIVMKSLTNTIDWLTTRLGKDMSKWQWKKLHTTVFWHVPFGRSGNKLLETVFNPPQCSLSGDNFTLHSSAISLSYEFQTGFGTANRTIFDPGDWEKSVSVITTGQSGHLWHPHREDQLRMWKGGKYHPMLFSREAIAAHKKDVLYLISE